MKRTTSLALTLGVILYWSSAQATRTTSFSLNPTGMTKLEAVRHLINNPGEVIYQCYPVKLTEDLKLKRVKSKASTKATR